MNTFQADLHIHTKLSPCGAWEMTPAAIVEHARRQGLNAIAICDHNAAGNIAAVACAGRAAGLTVIAGIEITTAEEIHVVGLFPGTAGAEAVAGRIQASLPRVDEAYTKLFGEQVLMDPAGAAVGCETSALALASALTLGQAVSLIQEHGGLAVAAHIERPSYSVYSQLGDLPLDVLFDAIEVSPVGNRPIGLREKFARYGFPMIGSSDSHYLHEIGRARTVFHAQSATFEELAAAVRGIDGRSVAYV